MKFKSLCVYCGTSSGLGSEYNAGAFAFGALLARKGITLIYGGGNVGLMGAVADGALGAEGKVIGVMPRSIIALNITHQHLTEFREVETMSERKKIMADLADGFVTLPGGYGTVEETMEILTWAQLGLHQKPSAFLNISGYFDKLAQFMEHMVQQGFLRQANLDRLIIDVDGDALLRRMEAQT